jgi:hypothetical protein
VVVFGLAAVFGSTEVKLIHGGAPGADAIAQVSARKAGIEDIPFPAAWGTHDWGPPVPCWNCKPTDVGCPAAGPRRNQRMLDVGKPDLVIAFAFDVTRLTRGTRDMYDRAVAAGVTAYKFGP